MSKHQEYCCGCKYDDVIGVRWKGTTQVGIFKKKINGNQFEQDGKVQEWVIMSAQIVGKLCQVETNITSALGVEHI